MFFRTKSAKIRDFDKKVNLCKKTKISMNLMSSQAQVIALNNTKLGNLVAQYIFIQNHENFLVKNCFFCNLTGDSVDALLRFSHFLHFFGAP
jgi:hypothetical protein